MFELRPGLNRRELEKAREMTITGLNEDKYKRLEYDTRVYHSSQHRK